MVGYEVVKRGPKGEPQQIKCTSHAGCTWSLSSTTWKTESDPIFVAQFNQHLKDKLTKDPQAFGHIRRARR